MGIVCRLVHARAMAVAGGDLARFHDSFDLSIGDGAQRVTIHTHVHALAERRRGPVTVPMQMPRAVMNGVPAVDRKVKEDDLLALDPNFLVDREVSKTTHEAPAEAAVVVALDQVFAAVKLLKDGAGTVLLVETGIAQMPHVSIGGDGLVPQPDEFTIHRLHIGKLAHADTQRQLVAEVGV